MTPSNVTATAPDDYQNNAITVDFADGETEKTVNIPIVDDTETEGDETINLALSNPTGGATIGTQDTAVLWDSVETRYDIKYFLKLGLILYLS